MAEDRWGDEWLPGMRVQVFNRYEKPGQTRRGVIVSRSWGRDRGKPIWWFTVKMDGVEGEWVFGPGQLNDCPPEDSK
jgi:hypothetical protein